MFKQMRLFSVILPHFVCFFLQIGFELSLEGNLILALFQHHIYGLY